MRKRKQQKTQTLGLTPEQRDLVGYWCDALIEAEQTEAASKSEGTRDVPAEDLVRGRCSPTVYIDLLRQAENKARGKQGRRRDGEQDDDAPLDVILCPVSVLRSRDISYGPSQLDLFWVPAKLESSGELFPPLRGAPWIPRFYLEPNVDDQYPVIGSEAKLDASSQAAGVRFQQWQEYWEYAESLFQAVTGSRIQSFELQGFTRRRNALVALNRSRGNATASMRGVYDRILSGWQHPGLIPALAYKAPVTSRPFFERREWILKMANRHSGQFGGAFALAPSQRRAIHQSLSLSAGEFICVSGPPGTGKTTLLQSLVASLWVSAVRDERSVPVIVVGTAATNQAVGNIITAMERRTAEQTLLAERWLPEVKSYGTYCISRTKAQNEQVLASFQTEQLWGESFSRTMERPEYIEAATSYFLKRMHQFSGRRMKLRPAVRYLANVVSQERAGLYRAVLHARDGSFSEWLQSLLWMRKRRSVEEFFSALSQFDCDRRARLFLLATHFWEARWLTEAQLLGSGSRRWQSLDRRGEERLTLEVVDWQRRAMITPLFVSTASMLPRFFSASRSHEQPPLDYLIVDEASQMSPEEGVVCLALANRAVIVGDDQQLEPVWGVPAHVDKANAKKFKLLGKDEERGWNSLTSMGLLASNGNLMRLALRCSKYNDGASTIGVFLSEQRRCVPEIVGVCNALAYRNRLIPARETLSERVIPALGYAHIEGRTEQLGTSRRNIQEAKAIEQWLRENREALEAYYGRKLQEIVAVITPFAAQAAYLSQKLGKVFSSQLRIGTVNSMQGAESEVVLFSTVYDGSFKEEYFFDRGTNMLNVAVSRAKDSFLVFGNVSLFRGRSGRPSWTLSRFLFQDSDNELSFGPLELEEEGGSGEHRWIATLAEHREALRNTIECARRELLIVSPTISSAALRADRIPELIADARLRNVRVVIYTDCDLDLAAEGLRPRAREGRQQLTEAGAEVVVVNGVHSKIICADEQIYIDGSFNWLSANRSAGSRHQKLETSNRYEGKEAKRRVKLVLDEMEYRGFIDQSNLMLA